MNFLLTPDQEQMRQVALSFAKDHLAPHAKEWDRTEFFPVATFKAAAKLGFAGLFVDEAYGGCALTRLHGALIFEGLSQGCVATAAYLSIHNMVAGLIQHFGSADQKQHFLPKLTTMDWLSSYCLTESQSGSDAASLRTTAKREGDHYVLNGSKAFISGGGVSDLYLCMVRTGAKDAKGISAILVEKGTPGLSFGKKEEKLGWRSQPTTTMMFDDVRVPVANRLGNEGEGFKIAMMGLDGGRINIASCSVGGADRCLSLAIDYVKTRRQFGQVLADFQSVQFKIAEMATQLDAARLMVHQAAFYLSEKHPESTLKCAMAKQFATDVGFKVVNEALQLHGGYGYIQDYEVERFLRDLRVHQILEGTNEIMKVIIARKVLGETT